MDKSSIYGIVGSILLILAIAFGISIFYQTHTIENATVIDLQQQQKISGSGNNLKTEIRFVVITDAETFIVENSVLNWKFNNSDLFYRLEKGKKYNFKVAGLGKGFFTDYRNILSFERR